MLMWLDSFSEDRSRHSSFQSFLGLFSWISILSREILSRFKPYCQYAVWVRTEEPWQEVWVGTCPLNPLVVSSVPSSSGFQMSPTQALCVTLNISKLPFAWRDNKPTTGSEGIKWFLPWIADWITFTKGSTGETSFSIFRGLSSLYCWLKVFIPICQIICNSLIWAFRMLCQESHPLFPHGFVLPYKNVLKEKGFKRSCCSFSR